MNQLHTGEERSSIFFLILRRMRPPLLLLIVTHAIAIFGLTLVPGADPEGNPYRMDFLHAVYFVSYTATTIGFGEIPYPLTPGQRLWVTGCIYLTVIAWFYAIGNLVALIQEPSLRRAITERRFRNTVRRVRDPFFLVCGFGDTGEALVERIVAQGRRPVVIDIDQERVDALRLREFPIYVPAVAADAGLPEYLELGGLLHPSCQAVVALARDEDINLHIAITAKLLNPGLTVICRSGSKEVETNMASFGTDHIIDPFDTFANRLFTALRYPCMDALYQWLVGNTRLTEPVRPPHGLWVLCGYGRFGKALYQRLKDDQNPVAIVEATPEKTGLPEDQARCIRGWGTDAATLKEAGIEQAVGIVAGTNNDTNNLSIIMTARNLNPNLFTVARRNVFANQALFRTAKADIVAEGSRIVAERIPTLLSTPLLIKFFRMVRANGDHYAREVVTRLAAVVGEATPEVWEVRLTEAEAPAPVTVMRRGDPLTIADLLRDPRDRTRRLPAVILGVERRRFFWHLPEESTTLQEGDHLLCCAEQGQALLVGQNCCLTPSMEYVCTGATVYESYVGRWLRRKRNV